MKPTDIQPAERLAMIEKMIQNARSHVTDNGFGWLLWGACLILASMSTYFLIEINAQNIFIGWNVFGIITILIFLYNWMKSKPKKMKTYVDEVMGYVDLGFAICLFVIIASINISVSPNSGFGYFLMIYAFLMLIQGGAMHFKPLLFGAVVNWIGALAIFINDVFKYDMLITALAVSIGYLIPGYILYRQSRKNTIVETATY